MNRLIDISPIISPQTAVWPGDVAFSQTFACRLSEGSNIDLSSIQTTVHIGAHCDAPSHYIENGESIESRDLDYYYGDAQVIHVDITQGERIMPSDIVDEIKAPRVLFATQSMPDPNHFNMDFCALSPEVVHYLADRNVVLIGIDTPSVDPAKSKALESHKAVAKRNLAILEGIILSHVPAGIYTLSAFPLRIHGADASPVRAVLIQK